MKRPLTFIALMTLAGFCHAQEEQPSFPPDRPGYTWGTEVLQLHSLSWENGFSFESVPDGVPQFTLNSTIVRYGIFQNVELRIGTDFLMSLNDGNPSFAVAPLTVGTKLKVYEGSGILPSIGLLAEFESPHIGSKEQLPSHLAPSMYVLFEHEIGESFWLCYNVGAEWDGETATPQTFLALSAGCNLTDQLGAYVETYNYLHPEEGNQHMGEFGFTWTPSPRVQLDLECDIDFKDLRHYIVGCGIAWMIH